MSIVFKVNGTEKLIAKLKAYQAAAPAALGAALWQQGEKIMADSKENYVPVDVGTLKGSGHVQLPEIGGGKVTVKLGYGGAAEDYALIQHEHLEFRHTVGQAKYLERPMLAAAPEYAANLVKAIRAFLAAGGK